MRLLELGASPNILCDYPAISPMLFGDLPNDDYFEATGSQCTP